MSPLPREDSALSEYTGLKRDRDPRPSSFFLLLLPLSLFLLHAGSHLSGAGASWGHIYESDPSVSSQHNCSGLPWGCWASETASGSGRAVLKPEEKRVVSFK